MYAFEKIRGSLCESLSCVNRFVEEFKNVRPYDGGGGGQGEEGEEDEEGSVKGASSEFHPPASPGGVPSV